MATTPGTPEHAALLALLQAARQSGIAQGEDSSEYFLDKCSSEAGFGNEEPDTSNELGAKRARPGRRADQE